MIVKEIMVVNASNRQPIDAMAVVSYIRRSSKIGYLHCIGSVYGIKGTRWCSFK